MAIAALKVSEQRPHETGEIFVNIDGDPLHGYKHWFESAVAEAELRDFTCYCLRHTFASRLVMQGVDFRTVADWMGHKTIQMTMRYAHLAPGHQSAAIERLASYSSTPSSEGRYADTAEPGATRGATEPENECQAESATAS